MLFPSPLIYIKLPCCLIATSYSPPCVTGSHVVIFPVCRYQAQLGTSMWRLFLQSSLLMTEGGATTESWAVIGPCHTHLCHTYGTPPNLLSSYLIWAPDIEQALLTRTLYLTHLYDTPLCNKDFYRNFTLLVLPLKVNLLQKFQLHFFVLITIVR